MHHQEMQCNTIQSNASNVKIRRETESIVVTIIMQMPFRRYILFDHNSVTCIIPEWFTQKRERMNNEQNSSDLD